MKYLVCLCMVISFIQSCGNSSSKKVRSNSKNFCLNLEQVYKSYLQHNNYLLNINIPILEKESQIISSANKGAIGYWYNSDSLFLHDYQLWKNYFKCK